MLSDCKILKIEIACHKSIGGHSHWAFGVTNFGTSPHAITSIF